MKPKQDVLQGTLVLGLLATWIPAQRALSIDPLRLLREEQRSVS
jgi:ABC-type lipoprotein release transport system permease subunit